MASPIFLGIPMQLSRFVLKLKFCPVTSAIALTTAISLVQCPLAWSLEQDKLLLLTTPLNTQQVAQFWAGNVPTDGSIGATNTISQASLTIPSLWWAQEQFGNDLLNYWVAYPGNDGIPPRVELMVDQQRWNQISYWDRYAFVNQIGTSAKDFGYNVRVFTWRGDLLGAYICDFSQAHFDPADTTSTAPISNCDVFLGLSAPGTFQPANSFGAP